MLPVPPCAELPSTSGTPGYTGSVLSAPSAHRSMQWDIGYPFACSNLLDTFRNPARLLGMLAW